MDDPALDPRGLALHGPEGLVSIDVSLSEQAPRYVLRGEDVAAIAFLPTPSPSADRLGAAWAALCASTAGPPPPTFDDLEMLLERLACRAHVGALALVAPSLYLDEEGEPARVRVSLLSPRLGAGFIGGEHNVASPVDRARHHIERSEGAVRIVCWQRFGLGSAIDPRGRYAAGSPRPLGWIRVSCDLDRAGAVKTHLACSYLPTVWFYRDGIRIYRAEAGERSTAEVRATLTPSPELPTGTTHRRLDAFGYVQPILGGAP